MSEFDSDPPRRAMVLKPKKTVMVHQFLVALDLMPDCKLGKIRQALDDRVDDEDWAKAGFGIVVERAMLAS